MKKDATCIENVKINNFRLLKDVDINIGKRLTLISGVNGVGKSTILGILAQICSFDKVYIPHNSEFKTIEIDPNLRTVYGEPFKSQFQDHFRISTKYDRPDNEYDVGLKIHDAQEGITTDAHLKGTHRGNSLRFVLRKDKTITKNTSRNITFPTIYLSNKRLTPIAAREINIDNNVFTNDEKVLFKKYIDKIFISPLNQKNRTISSNKDDISSSVITNQKYDIESASTGEDNLGQIVAAMISFIRLSKWKYYTGGLLLIDEIENSLFPRAQSGLLEVLRSFSAKYNVQVVFTSHSPIVISKMLQFREEALKNAKNHDDIGINFLTDSSGKVTNLKEKDITLDRMIAALEVRPVANKQIPKVNCYCEDKEGYLFLKSILPRTDLPKYNFMNTVTLGSENFIELMKHHVPEFERSSIIVLDGDKSKQVNKMKNKNILFLPSYLPPDQLMFKLLYDLSPDADYWRIDPDNWNYEIFLNNQDIINNVEFNEETNKYELKSKSNKKVRDYFKEWFNNNYAILREAKTNPIVKIWKPQHKKEIEAFKQKLDAAYDFCFSNVNYFS